MSTASGIADFRSSGGVWSRYKSVTIQEFVSDLVKGGYSWKCKRETIPYMLDAKPNTVSFGQNLDPEHLTIAARASSECDLFMALGSSLVVKPACSSVEVAHQAGVPVIIMNRDETPYDSIASVRTGISLAEALPLVI